MDERIGDAARARHRRQRGPEQVYGSSIFKAMTVAVHPPVIKNGA
jgi:hypothetical protein